MNDLSGSPDPQIPPAQSMPLTASSVSALGGKEAEPGGLNPPEGLRAATSEMELSKEVSSAGVYVHPTAIPIPPRVSQMGVQPAGNNIPITTTTMVVPLPLSDDQIVQGLHESVTKSVRWLANWCVRQLKKLHVTLKSTGGKTTRVKIQ